MLVRLGKKFLIEKKEGKKRYRLAFVEGCGERRTEVERKREKRRKERRGDNGTTTGDTFGAKLSKIR